MKHNLKKMKLFPKTFLFMLALFAVVILLTHISIYLFLPRFYLNSVQNELDRRLKDLGYVIESVDSAACQDILENYARQNSVNIIAEMNGEKMVYQGATVQVVSLDRTENKYWLENVENVESIVIQSYDVTNDDGVLIHLQMMVNIQPGREAVRTTLALLPLTSGIAVLFSILFAYLHSRQITKPIHNMLSVTRDMQDLKPEAYFQVEGEDEIGILAGQINLVYRQLWQTISNLEREKEHIAEMEKAKAYFLRSASHELKTPLAGLRILLENMQLGIGKYKDHTTYLGEGINTVDQLSNMVKEILASSSIQGEALQAPKEELCVQEEVSDVLKSYEILMKSRQLDIAVHIDEALRLHMNGNLFRQVLSNLLSNAVRYTDAGGQIKIEGHAYTLSVWNSCTPLSEEEISRCFELFYRSDPARASDDSGSGMGLYIVREILTANQISFAFQRQGNGMCFLFRIPMPESA